MWKAPRGACAEGCCWTGNADTSPGATGMPASAAGDRQRGTKAPGPGRFSETGEPCPASLDIRSAEKSGLRWDQA